MKLRINKNHINFRITDSELASLLSSQKIIESLALPDNVKDLEYTIVVSQEPMIAAIELVCQPNVFILNVNKEALQSITKEGIKETHGVTTFSLEVDLFS